MIVEGRTVRPPGCPGWCVAAPLSRVVFPDLPLSPVFWPRLARGYFRGMDLDAFFAFKPDGVLLSSSIGEVPIYCRGECTEISVQDSHGVSLFGERMWADVNGCVVFYELASLVADFMRAQGLSFEVFSLRTPSDSVELPVLFSGCEALCGDVPVWLSENFLTGLSSRRVAPDAAIPLWLWAEQGESLSLSVEASVRMPSGMVDYCSFSVDSDAVAGERGVVQMSLSVEDVAARAAALCGVCDLLGFSVRCGHRSLSCFVSEELRGMDVFYFRNRFNVWDLFCLPSVTLTKSEVDMSLGVVAGTARAYDRRVSRSYEVETGALSAQEAAWADEFLCSHEVVRLVDGAFLPVIVTECGCSVADRPQEPDKVSFSWRYASERPVQVLPLPAGVFSRQFNPVFS